MNWNNLIRQGHRWVAMAFTLLVVANIAAVGSGHSIEWLYLLPLAPLALLLLSGLWLFALPYLTRRRRAG